MKIKSLTRAEVRQVDQIAIEQYGIPGIVLMENAGSGAAKIINDVAKEGSIAILCGKGNNAGDGYVIARHLEIAGRKSDVLSIVSFDELCGDAAINYEIAKRSKLPMTCVENASSLHEVLGKYDCIVDCLLGTGASGTLHPNYANAIVAANKQTAIRIAIDVPTGLDCDSGLVDEQAFQANHTITFVAPKQGLLESAVASFVGQIHVVGIGVPTDLLERFETK